MFLSIRPVVPDCVRVLRAKRRGMRFVLRLSILAACYSLMATTTVVVMAQTHATCILGLPSGIDNISGSYYTNNGATRGSGFSVNSPSSFTLSDPTQIAGFIEVVCSDPNQLFPYDPYDALWIVCTSPSSGVAEFLDCPSGELPSSPNCEVRPFQCVAGSTLYPAVTDAPTTQAPTTQAPTTQAPTTPAPTTVAPTTQAPTTSAPTTQAPTTAAPTTRAPTTQTPTTLAPTTLAPTTQTPTTLAPTTHAPTTVAPTTQAPTTQAPTTQAPTTSAPTTQAPTTAAPTVPPETSSSSSSIPTAEIAAPAAVGGFILIGGLAWYYYSSKLSGKAASYASERAPLKAVGGGRGGEEEGSRKGARAIGKRNV